MNTAPTTDEFYSARLLELIPPMLHISAHGDDLCVVMSQKCTPLMLKKHTNDVDPDNSPGSSKSPPVGRIGHIRSLLPRTGARG